LRRAALDEPLRGDIQGFRDLAKGFPFQGLICLS